MALLYDARPRAIDADGVSLVGATLTINIANTSTPAALFRDVGLAVPMTNPTSGPDVSDAGGWFPQIFAEEGTVVDITLKDSGGSTVKAYVDVTFLGADTGDFRRTLADDTRLRFTGSGGRVLMQFGDPDPDNTGGKLTIEGWNGSQADEILIDTALLDTTGRIKEGGKKLPGTVYTEATAFTAQANVDIALPNNPTGVRAWKLHIFDLTASATTTIWLQLSYDGGGTFKSGASDYGDAAAHNVNATMVSHGQVTTQINIDNILSGGKKGFIELTVLTPDAGADPTMIMGQMISYENTTPAPSMQHFGGLGLGSYGRATHLRITSAGQTFTGKYRIERLYGFGET